IPALSSPCASPYQIFWVFATPVNFYNQIKGCVQRAWKNRERVDTQEDLITEVIRVKYRGSDLETGYTLEMWQNQSTGIVETAYPIAK
ncbi:hypothetical protein QUA82_32660, partial [Microcoleus sp. F8-D3]